jgi:hypothetical protein
MNQMFPGQEPTSEAEIARQQDDPIGAIILANADVSPNDNTSSNDSIGQQMASMASSQQDSRSLSDVMLPPTPSRRLPATLDIDTSPEEMRRRVREERKKPAYSIGAMIHAAMTGQQFGSPDYDPDLKVILRH